MGKRNNVRGSSRLTLTLSLFLPRYRIIKCNEDQLSSLSGIKRLKRVHSKRVLNPNKRLLKIQILCKTRRETTERRRLLVTLL